MKKNELIKYTLLFVFFFVSLTFIFTLSRGDTFVNYGFSYALAKGEIPYKDFNMVITPFAPMLYSIGLFVYNNILMIYLEQALLLTILFYYLEKLLDKKSILMLLILIIPYPIAFVSIIYPGYNFLIVLLMFMFIYYFKNNKNDYMLGVLLGLIFCTKQTIGLILFIPTVYYLFKDRRKFIKIFIGCLIPCFLLLLYLLLTKSFNSFIDLCFLGLFDFGHSNLQVDIFYLLLLVIGIIYLIYRIYNDKKNILLYYLLLFGIVVYPIIDYYHVSLFLIVIAYLIVDDIKVKKNIYKYINLLIVVVCLLWSFISYQYLKPISITNYKHFGLVINREKYAKTSKKLINYCNSLNEEVIYFMRGSENYFYKIINDKKLTYFDLPNNGNYGYNGIARMKNKINNKHNVYFVIDRKLVKNNDSNQQYIKELGQFVIKESKKTKSIGVYDIYYKE